MIRARERQLGIVGLGRMGGGLALNARDEGLRVVGYSRSGVRPEQLAAGVEAADDLAGLLRLERPRVVLMYLPAGRIIDETLDALATTLERDDVVVDGGNSYWGDSIARHARLAQAGLRFVDLGTSGGVTGARHGACFMAGGDADAVALVEPLVEALAVPGGFVHAGPPGAGHFVKLVHNGIEFGMLQAIAEGLDLLEHHKDALPVADVLAAWRHGSVIRSWLLDLLEAQYRARPLDDVPAYVEDTGEVNWLVSDALRMERPIPVISQAIQQLLLSRDGDRTWARAVAMMRHGFGEHPFGHDDHIRRERREGLVGRIYRGEEGATTP
jgi:6-phosphogluconate dehydrogenase